MVEESRFRGGKTPYGYRLEKSGILNKRKHVVNKPVIDENAFATSATTRPAIGRNAMGRPDTRCICWTV